MLLRILLIMLLAGGCNVHAWLVAQPKENVWVTLAKTLQQKNICMTMGSADNPLATCLVGIPLKPSDYPFTGKKPNPVDSWDEWTKILPHAPEEPQELELLGSSKATYCIRFSYKRITHSSSKLIYARDVSPTRRIYMAHNWCNYTADRPSKSFQNPRVLPQGVFLICGDRVWAGIPSRLQGGPCTLGKLAVLTPNTTLIQDWRKNKTQLARQKRQITQLDENCDSQITDWPHNKRVLMSIFLPWVAAAKALGEISHIECWLGKNANLTSSVLSDLLEEEETIKHATLQNRAAIDYLLLAHGHGCEEFDGLCCFNISAPGESIHKKILELRGQVQDLKTEKDPEWFENLFGHLGLKGWVASFLNSLVWIVIIVVVVLFTL